VRQLENICHWLTVMAPAQVIEPKDLPPEVALTPGAAPVEAAVRAEPVVRAGGTLEEGITVPPPLAMPAAHAAPILHGAGWETGLEAEALELLATGRHDVWDELTKRFESKLILTALANTRGRRIEAAQKLGIGRNTITRKIQELGLE
jgi:two-component system nitrogen regulation response regulator GlnG